MTQLNYADFGVSKFVVREKMPWNFLWKKTALAF